MRAAGDGRLFRQNDACRQAVQGDNNSRTKAANAARQFCLLARARRACNFKALAGARAKRAIGMPGCNVLCRHGSEVCYRIGGNLISGLASCRACQHSAGTHSQGGRSEAFCGCQASCSKRGRTSKSSLSVLMRVTSFSGTTAKGSSNTGRRPARRAPMTSLS